MLQTKVKRKTYQEKIAEFNKLYGPFEFIDHVEAQDGWRCEACGSHAPGHFFLYQDRFGNICHVGGECHTNLITTWKGGRCEGCRCIRTVIKTKVKLPNNIEAFFPLCSKCISLLDQPCSERDIVYKVLMERTRVRRR